MTIRELVIELLKHNQRAQIVLGSDEELNTMFRDIEVAELTDETTNGTETKAVIYGLSGSEE